jgi:hypothetical protein
MESNKLRIGNYYLAFGVDLKQVETLTKDKILIDFTPIPLTEEWLLKLGLFKITKKEDLWGNDEIGVYDFKGKIRWSDFFITSNTLKDFTLYVATIDDGMESAECLNNIIYVHQLQNLWFALTGEELTITK